MKGKGKWINRIISSDASPEKAGVASSILAPGTRFCCFAQSASSFTFNQS